MPQDQHDRLPTSDWLSKLLNRKLETIAMELEQDEKIAPLDFDRLMMHHRENFMPRFDCPEVDWEDDWED